jgi:hypothetical protein
VKPQERGGEEWAEEGVFKRKIRHHYIFMQRRIGE